MKSRPSSLKRQQLNKPVPESLYSSSNNLPGSLNFANLNSSILAFRQGLVSQKTYWILDQVGDVSIKAILDSLHRTHSPSTADPHLERRERRPNVGLITRVPVPDYLVCAENPQDLEIVSIYADIFDCDTSRYPDRLILLGMFAYEASRAVWTEKQRGVESIDQTAVKKALKRLIRELAVASAWFYATHTLPRTEQMTVEGTALAYRDGRILMSGFGSKLAEESYTSGLFPNTFYSFQNATLHVGFVEVNFRFHDIVPGSVSPYTDDSSEKLSRMMRLDCRGLQPLAFSPRVGWRVTSSVSSRVFEDVELGQGDWTDYDDDGDQCVGVFDVVTRSFHAGFSGPKYPQEIVSANFNSTYRNR
ncbi:hypothetical protein SprV_0902793900 [Sparganum proliferum]